MRNFSLCTLVIALFLGGCGEAPPEAVVAQNQEIVGGEDVPVGALPYMAALFYREWDPENPSSIPERHLCGGTVIDAELGLVLTAAHCVTDSYPFDDPDSEDPSDWSAGAYLPDEIQVTIGSHALSTVAESDMHDVVEIIAHPGFDQDTLENDIALLRVDGIDPSTPTPRVIGGRRYDPALLLPGLPAMVAGWGDLGNDEYPDVLQWVRVPLVDRNVCDYLLRTFSEGGSIPVTSTMLCAGPLLGGRDACGGDSGGPLLVRDLDGRRVLAGIVSWGDGCAEPLKPGVYTNISAVRSWLDGCTSGGTCPRLPELPPVTDE